MSVFSKIVFSFWIAVALSVLATVYLYPPPHDQSRAMQHEILPLYCEALANRYERGQSSDLDQVRNDAAVRRHLEFALFNAEGNQIVGSVPPQLRSLIDFSKSTSNFETQRERVSTLACTSNSGKKYTIVGVSPNERPGPLGPPGPPQALFSRLLVLVLVSGLVCYALAKYLTAPLVVLRKTTNRLAAGDLTARAPHTRSGNSDEISRLVKDFNTMANRIQSLVHAERRLTSDISHELRSPLARVNVALEIARRKSGEEQTRALDRIETEAARLDQLIGEILKLSQLETQVATYSTTAVDVSELVEIIASDAEFEARAKQVQVQCNNLGKCFVRGDRNLIRSALENVVRNAIRYTKAGTSVELSAQCGRNNRGEYVTVTVRDHGPGVPDDALQLIFEPFYRVSSDRSRQTGGSGLGLAIASRAISIHGGTLAAENAPDGGLLVHFTLPAYSGQAQPDLSLQDL